MMLSEKMYFNFILPKVNTDYIRQVSSTTKEKTPTTDSVQYSSVNRAPS